MIEAGQKLPDATVLVARDGDGKEAQLSKLLMNKKTVLFAMVGAYTGDCNSAHMPSVIRSADALREKGVDEIFVLTVNDPFVVSQWARDSGAEDAGITMLCDPDAAFTRSVCMDFTFLPKGLVRRSNRYALVLDDGTVSHALIEDPGVCAASTGEAVLDII